MNGKLLSVQNARKVVAQQWRPKLQNKAVQRAVQPNTGMNNEFQITKQGSKRKESVSTKTSITNSFGPLSEMESEEDIIVENMVCGNGTKRDDRGGDSPVDECPRDFQCLEAK